MDDYPSISRIVHLQGGLRATDVGGDRVFVQSHAVNKLLHFPAPEYASLYASLKDLGFSVIGVEFVSRRNRFDAPDWGFSPPQGRFRLVEEGRAWGELRHTAYTNGKLELVDITRRCVALLELLGLRILQMSNAYNGVYLAQAQSGRLKDGILFDNTYTHYIEAAIHAFLGDAINLRNLLFEFSWAYVLQKTAKKLSFKELKQQAKAVENRFVLTLVNEGERGWLKHLSDLRDGVFHFAPIGARHSFPACHTRAVTLSDGGRVHYVSYGLIDRTVAESSMNCRLDDEDQSGSLQELQAYRAQLDDSRDALEYVWTALGDLICLCKAARISSGLKGEMPRIGPQDMVSFSVEG